jgi:hypothetical protein
MNEVQGQRHCRAGYVGAGRRLMAMALNTLASGQTDLMATRMFDALFGSTEKNLVETLEGDLLIVHYRPVGIGS